MRDGSCYQETHFNFSLKISTDHKYGTCWQMSLNFILNHYLNIKLAMAMLVAHLATLCKILVTSTQFLVALASRKGQFWTLKLDPKPKIAAVHATLECHAMMAFLVNG